MDRKTFLSEVKKKYPGVIFNFDTVAFSDDTIKAKIKGKWWAARVRDKSEWPSVYSDILVKLDKIHG